MSRAYLNAFTAYAIAATIAAGGTLLAYYARAIPPEAEPFAAALLLFGLGGSAVAVGTIRTGQAGWHRPSFAMLAGTGAFGYICGEGARTAAAAADVSPWFLALVVAAAAAYHALMMIAVFGGPTGAAGADAREGAGPPVVRIAITTHVDCDLTDADGRPLPAPEPGTPAYELVVRRGLVAAVDLAGKSVWARMNARPAPENDPPMRVVMNCDNRLRISLGSPVVGSPAAGGEGNP